MQVRARILVGITVVAMVAALGWLVLRHIRVPRVVGRAVAPDGTEMCVVQQFNWSIEMFTTSFVYRRPGGNWNWYYFDHQDYYWGSSRAELDPSRGVAVFDRDGSPAVTFAWATEAYTLHRWKRTSTGSQMQMPAGWGPHLSIYSR